MGDVIPEPASSSCPNREEVIIHLLDSSCSSGMLECVTLFFDPSVAPRAELSQACCAFAMLFIQTDQTTFNDTKT